MPRPPIQHHRILLTLPNEWEDVFDRAREIVTIQAVGRASAGFLSNPTNGAIILASIVGIMGGVLGKDVIDTVVRYFGSIGTLLDPGADQTEKSVAANDAAKQLKEIIDIVTLGATRIIPGP